MTKLIKRQSSDFFSVEYPESVMFNGTEVYLPKSLFYFAAAKAVFQPEIKRVCDQAIKDFDANVGTMEKFVKNAEEWFIKAVRPLFTFSIDKLAENGSYELDDKLFFQKYASDDFDRIAKIHGEMEREYTRIRERQQQINEEREARRRFKNATEERSVLASVVSWGIDQGKEIIDEANNDSRYNSLFNAERKAELQNEIRYICNKILEDFTQALYDTTRKDMRCPLSEEDMKKGERIFEKLRKGIVQSSQLASVALDAFQANPLLDGFLPWCVETFHDKDGGFQTIARLLSVEEDVIALKNNKLKEVVKVDTEQEALKSQARINQLEKALSFQNSEYDAKIANAIATFDLKARTIDGVEYTTRDEAREVSRQLSRYEELRKSYTLTTVDICDTFLQKVRMEKLSCNAVAKRLQEVEETRAELDKLERNVDGVEYKTLEEAREVRRQLSRFEELKQSYIPTTVDRCDTLLKEARQEKLTCDAVTKRLQEVEEKRAELDKLERNVDGVEYKTLEEAREVRRQLTRFEELKQSYIPTTVNNCDILLEKARQEKLTCDAVARQLQDIENKRKELDKQDRTVDGIEYKNNEEAQKASQERVTIDEIVKRHLKVNSVHCQALVDALENAGLLTESSKKYIEKEHLEVEKQKQKEHQLQEKYHITADESVILNGQKTLLEKYKDNTIISIEPWSFDARQKSTEYAINDESIFGWIDLVSNVLLLTIKGIYILNSKEKGAKFTELFIDIIKKNLILNLLLAWFTCGLSFLVIAAKTIYDTSQTKKSQVIETFLPWQDLTIEIPSQQQNILVLNRDTVVTFENKKAINRDKYVAFLKKMALISGNTTNTSQKPNEAKI